MKTLEEIRSFFENDRFATENAMVIDEVADGYAKCSMLISERHRNAVGGVMGGVPFTLADLLSLPFLFAIFYVYFSAYAIYAYIEKKSDAIFIAKYLSVILLLSGLPTLFTGNLTDIIFNLGVPVGFFLFLTYSKEINKRMPKEERKLTKLNKIMVILSIIVQVFLYIGDFMETELNAATVMDSDEKMLKEICRQQKETLPRNLNEEFYWADMRLNGDVVEFIYVYNEGMTPELGELEELINIDQKLQRKPHGQ